MSTLEFVTAIEHTSRKRLIDYPESDGKPVAETEVHITELLNCIAILAEFFWAREDVYVAGNNFVFWNEGHPKDRLSPDTYVVFGVDKRVRNSYRSWEEDGKLPDVIFEFTSRSTKQQDTESKFSNYERIFKTSEYFLFDPKGEFLSPRLQGYRLMGGEYVRLETTDGRLFSERLGLELYVVGSRLTFYDPKTKSVLKRLRESNEFIEMQTYQIEAEKRRADVQTRLADEERDIAQAEKQRADEERAVAQTEKQRADEERDIAQAEKQRADDNQAIIRKLMAQLEEKDRKDNTDER